MSRNRFAQILIAQAVGMQLACVLCYGGPPTPETVIFPRSQVIQQTRGVAFTLDDANGNNHSAGEWEGAKVVIFFFISPDCPISNRYAPEINRLAAEYSRKDIHFYGVYSDPAVEAEEVRSHGQAYGYDFPLLLDPKQVLASRFRVTGTPTAIVLAPAEGVLYQGRIDDSYLGLGRYRNSKVREDLRLALEAVLNGMPIAVSFTKVIGCNLPPRAKDKTNDEKTLTYP